MRRLLIMASVLVVSPFLLVLSACGALRNDLRTANLSAPVVTGTTGGPDETVWWAEHRASESGANDVRVIMCSRGNRPVCVRIRPEDAPAR